MARDLPLLLLDDLSRGLAARLVERRRHLAGLAADFQALRRFHARHGLLFAWPPFRYWRFERYLSEKATTMAEGHRAHVHCNTVVDTLFDSNSLAAGHADWTTGAIVFQYPWCGRLMDYLAHPEKADHLEIASLNIFTHESMHVRGERNEAITECQSVQRNYRAAKLLGVPDAAAKSAAMTYYTQLYMQRAGGVGFNAVYFSSQCAPGKALDERLDDSAWGPPS